MKDAPTRLTEQLKPAKATVTSRPELATMSRIDKLLLALDDEARERVLAWIIAIHGCPAPTDTLDVLRKRLESNDIVQ